MPVSIAANTSIETLGRLIVAAHGLDTSWMKDGACFGWGSTRPYEPTPWQVAHNSRQTTDIPPAEMVKYALLLCAGCQVQWGCARYAIEGEMIAGTWSMPLSSLEWLRRRADRDDIIDDAERSGTPMQVAVRQRQAAPAT